MDSPVEHAAQVEALAASVPCLEGWPEEAQTASPGTREASGRSIVSITLTSIADEPADEAFPAGEMGEVASAFE